MPYDIEIILDNHIIDEPFYNPCDWLYVCRDFQKLSDKYPATEGYQISVSRVGSKVPPYNRDTFLQILGKAHEEQLKAFYLQEEYEAFIALKKKLRFKDLDPNEIWDDLYDIDNLAFVYVYVENFCILQLYDDSAIDDRDFIKYQIPYPWYPNFPESRSLQELEPILYLIWLGDGN
jgi:hypothetical protein